MLDTAYQSIYLLVVFMLTLIFARKYTFSILLNVNRKTTSYTALSFILAMCFALFIGFRPISIAFVDMVSYDEVYSQLFGSRFYFDKDVDNLLYDNWLAYMASLSIPVKFFFLSVAVVYFGMIWLACRKLFPNDTIIAFLVYLAAFSTFSYATNGIKAGMASSIFLVALAYYEKPLISIPVALLTYAIHHSMLLVIVAYFITLLCKKPRYYLVVWVVAFVISALHITYFQYLFAGLTDEHGAEYLLSSAHSGFRLDFILYSAVPVVVGYLMLTKYKIRSKTYNVILSLYLLTNSVWMLCMYSSFTNRISYLSWFLYPIVLLYPFLNATWSRRQALYLKYVIWGHISFTIFMNVIYYGLLK